MTTFRPYARVETDPTDRRYRTVWIEWLVDGEEISGRHGLSCTPRNAERLTRAIHDGAVLVDPEVRTDVHGGRYVAARCLVMAKYINSDLRKLGY